MFFVLLAGTASWQIQIRDGEVEWMKTGLSEPPVGTLRKFVIISSFPPFLSMVELKKK